MSWRYYEKSTPREVEDGIEARSKRGDIGEEWWSRRFVDVVESYSKSNRITRGKRYARKGQVVELDVEEGRVTAKVQGSQRDPYEVRISGDALDEAGWEQVEAAMAERAGFAARLLAEEMPPDIEEAFEACAFSLFPDSYGDMRTNCSCPDSADPCKHLAATFYILAERFDEDPFLIFRWRGRSREDLLANLRELRGGGGKSSGRAADRERGDDRPIGECLDAFWSVGEPAGSVTIRPGTTETPDAALDRLGDPPGGLDDVDDELRELYRRLVEAPERAEDRTG